MVRLKPVEAGGPYVMVISGNNRIELVNILAGEVWVCSGQSNMDSTVERAVNAKEEIAAADDNYFWSLDTHNDAYCT